MSLIETTASANFGGRKGGLSTVGFTLFAKDKTEVQARTTNGVSELIANTGLYQVFLAVDSAFIGSIVWDTGEVSGKLYAIEDIDFRKFIAQSVIVSGDLAKKVKDVWSNKEKQKVLKDVKDIVGIVQNMKVIDHTLVLENIGKKLESVKEKGAIDFRVISESLELIRANVKKGDAIKELEKGINLLSEGLAAIIDNKEVEGVVQEVDKHVIKNT